MSGEFQGPGGQAPHPPPRDGSHRGSLTSRVLHRMRNYLIAGLLVTGPIGLTVWLSWVLIAWVDGRVMPLIPVKYHPETYLPFYIPGLGLIVVILGLVLAGALATNLLGRTFVRMSEHILDRMPIVRGIYGTFKQVFQTVLSQQSQAFRQVVMVEYPRRGIWALGFLTGATVGEVQNLTKERVLNIFLPTTPNPTSGFLLFVPQEDVLILDMSVEDGIKMVMSGGIVTPPDRRPVKEKSVPKVSAKINEQADALRERKKSLPQDLPQDQPDRA